MSAVLEILAGTTGLTLTAKLYPDASDTLAATVTLTEATNRVGLYTGPATGLTGLHLVEVLNGSALFGAWWVTMATSGTVTAEESRYDAAIKAKTDLITDLTAAQTEPAQGAPAANASVLTKIAHLYKAWRNKKTQTATTFSLYDDAGTTVDHKATTSDDGTTATVGEIGSGP